MNKLKPPIKICYVTSVDITVRFILLNHLKFLEKEGYDVYVVCSSGKWIKEVEQEGIKVKTIKFKRKISPLCDLASLVKLFFYLKKEKFDIVHTHTPKAGLIGQLAAKMAGVPIIVNTVHGFYFQKTDSSLKRRFYILIEKIAAKCSSLIFFVNKEDMMTAVKEKICSPKIIKYFGGGVDLARFNPERFSRDFIIKNKKDFGINLEGKVVGIVARLVKEKGYLDLFQAFREIIIDFPKITLLAVGLQEPEKKDSIGTDIFDKYKIEKNFIFLGERTDVERIYALMDIFVLPSYREGLGVSIIEASAMGKPVVSTDIRGCREVVNDGVTGKLVPPGDSHKLAEAIMYLIKNSAEADRMGKNGRKKVMKEFNEEVIFGRIKEGYESLIKEKKINGAVNS